MAICRKLVVASVFTGVLQIAGFLTASAGAATLSAADGPECCAAAPRQQLMWQDLADGDVCLVTAFGRVTRAAPAIFYQLQSYRLHEGAPDGGTASSGVDAGGSHEDGQGAVLFSPSRDGRTLTTIGGWSGNAALVYAPEIVRTSQGTLLVLRMSATVSAHPTDDVVFRVLAGRWVQVSANGWWKGVHAPKGLSQRNGNAMDWPTLRAYGAFWREADAQCCPTGGSYIAQLRLDGTQLRLAAIRYSRGELLFP